MNYLRNCRTCGGPVYGSWLYSYHDCKPTPYAVVYQAPALPAPKPVEAADSLTHDEASRLCSRITEQIDEHYTSCEYCNLVRKLQLQIRPCEDMLSLQEVLKHWEQYTLIEVDRKARP